MVKEIDPSLRLHFDTPQERGEILCELDRISRGFEGLLKPSIIGPTDNEKRAFGNIRDSIRKSCPPVDIDLSPVSGETRRVSSVIVLELIGVGVVSFSLANDWRKIKKRMGAWKVNSPSGRGMIWAEEKGVCGRRTGMTRLRRIKGPIRGIRNGRY